MIHKLEYWADSLWTKITMVVSDLFLALVKIAFLVAMASLAGWVILVTIVDGMV